VVFRLRLALAAFAVASLSACSGGESATITGPPVTEPPPAAGSEWPRFGVDAARSDVFPGATGIGRGNVATLRRQQVTLPGTVDSSAVFAERRFFVTTSYGKAIAIDAQSGKIVWTFTPEGIEQWEGTSQITQASPVLDPDSPYLYSVSPDGRVHKLSRGDGREVRDGSWPTIVSLDPAHEKIAPALNLAGNLIYVATGGYFGDAPPYQGHVVALDRDSGRIVNVFNTLCSDREGLLDPATCPESGSAIWGRGGVVVEPHTGNLLVATGNGEWNGTTHWGDSLLELSPDAGQLLQNFTPRNEQALDDSDADLASASPAVVSPHFVVQGGKDGILRLLDLRRLNGSGGSGPRKGGAVGAVDAPGATGVFTAPAVWQRGGSTRVFVASLAGTAAYRFEGKTLTPGWSNEVAGTSPVLAGGLLYVYDAGGSGLHVYDPRSGRAVATLPAGEGHWNSPIVIDGKIALPQGSANDHETTGVLNIYRRP
jgi:outer membrane protein assembly factor BamB